MTALPIKQIADVVLEKLEKTHKLNGTILLSINDKPLIEKSYGVADDKQGKNCSSDTIYCIGSLTKQFIAAALLKALYDHCLTPARDQDNPSQLKDRLSVSLHTPIADYLPKDDALWENQIPDWAYDVTLHHLLTHTSGIVNFTNTPEYFSLRKKIAIKPQEVLALFKNQKLNFEPGSNYTYSNSGYIILGEIITRITNESLSHYLPSQLFKPSKMDATFYCETGTIRDLKNSKNHHDMLARGYMYDLFNPNKPVIEIEAYEPMDIARGAGAILSSAIDLLKWNHALYQAKIIPSFLVELMTQMHIETDLDSPLMEKSGYGYGLGIHRAKGIGTLYTHTGRIQGFSTKMTHIPSLKMTIICLCNVMQNWDPLIPKINEIKAQLLNNLSEEQLEKMATEMFYARNPDIYRSQEYYSLPDFETHFIEELSELLSKP